MLVFMEEKGNLKGPSPGLGTAKQGRHIDHAVTILSAEYYTDVHRENSWEFKQKLALPSQRSLSFPASKTGITCVAL